MLLEKVFFFLLIDYKKKGSHFKRAWNETRGRPYPEHEGVRAWFLSRGDMDIEAAE